MNFLHIPDTILPGSPGRGNGRTGLLRSAPDPLKVRPVHEAVKNGKLKGGQTDHDPSQNELASFISNHMPEN